MFADLRPYICLSEDCTAAENWFARRHEWILHEIENHWMSYVCPYSCSETFQSRSKCVEHVHITHPGNVPEHQLEAMINHSCRPVRAEDEMSCPMCHESLGSVKKYQRHVGRHQEQLAIFALPTTQSQDDEHDLDDDDDESNPIKSDAGSEGTDTVDDKVHLEEPHIEDEHSRESYTNVHTVIIDEQSHAKPSEPSHIRPEVIEAGPSTRTTKYDRHSFTNLQDDHGSSADDEIDWIAERHRKEKEEEEERHRRIRLRIAVANAEMNKHPPEFPPVPLVSESLRQASMHERTPRSRSSRRGSAKRMPKSRSRSAERSYSIDLASNIAISTDKRDETSHQDFVP